MNSSRSLHLALNWVIYMPFRFLGTTMFRKGEPPLIVYLFNIYNSATDPILTSIYNLNSTGLEPWALLWLDKGFGPKI